MKNILLKIAYILLLLIPIVLNITKGNTYAQEETQGIQIATYFTGIGCPHCTIASPYIKEVVDDRDNFLVIEYEIYDESRNASLITTYNDTYKIGMGIPVIFFNHDTKLVGDSMIKNNLLLNISNNTTPNTVQLDDKSVNLDEFNVNQLKGYPKIYAKDRVAIRKELSILSDIQNRELLTFLTQDLDSWSKGTWEGELITPQIVKYPGGSSTYQHALKVNGWILQWNGEVVKTTTEINSDSTFCDEKEEEVCKEDISFTKILGLAVADSINPCAVSILLLMLLAITTYNPKDRKQILFSGLAFVLAVIVMYLIYGFLIIKAFQFLQSITVFKEYLYKGLGFIALILGALEIKDYFKYKPGSVGTEMPLFLRPKMQNIVSRITSPIGAFGMGLFVTLFLLPCTIGPYVILGGMLSSVEFLKSLPYLLVYNVIFVLPMIGITLIIFFGTKNIKDISDWRNTNVRKMHLASGILMVLLALTMIFGLL
jgi:cytochrome c biogenesis protein CcdA